MQINSREKRLSDYQQPKAIVKIYGERKKDKQKVLHALTFNQ